MNSLIDLQFSKFYSWNERENYEKYHFPSVYAISLN